MIVCVLAASPKANQTRIGDSTVSSNMSRLTSGAGIYRGPHAIKAKDIGKSIRPKNNIKPSPKSVIASGAANGIATIADNSFPSDIAGSIFTDFRWRIITNVMPKPIAVTKASKSPTMCTVAKSW